MSASLLVERRGAAEWITLNRPERLNAITGELATALADRFAALHDDREVRVVVLRGAGRAFCAGLDIKERVDGRGDQRGIDRLPEIIRSMTTCPQPIVALVHGAACGGGFAFALAADVRIAAESARMNDAFVNLGVSGCELGVTYHLPRQVGLSNAAELMLTGRFVDAARAERIGLVSAVVPDDALEAAGEAIVADMLRVAPLALRKTKETLRRALALADLDAVIDLENETQAACMRGPDFAEGLQAFVDKRPPRFARA